MSIGHVAKGGLRQAEKVRRLFRCEKLIEFEDFGIPGSCAQYRRERRLPVRRLLLLRVQI